MILIPKSEKSKLSNVCVYYGDDIIQPPTCPECGESMVIFDWSGTIRAQCVGCMKVFDMPRINPKIMSRG